MTTCFYLLPGARLPGPAACAALDRLEPGARAEWTSLGDDREPPGLQPLADAPHNLSPHLAWLWKVLTHRAGAPVAAPYAWIASGGPVLDQEFWRLTPMRASETGFPAEVTIAGRDIPRAACALDPVASKFGLRLMISGSDLYLCRRTPWALSARPFADLGRTPFGAAEAELTGEDRDEALELARALADAARSALPDAGIAGFWIWGGGRYEPIFPPSTFRSVAADDPVALAWAASAGIPKAALVRASGGERALSAFTKAPSGDRIVVLDGLLEAWRARDAEAWAEALPGVLAELRRWRALEKDAGVDDAVFVLFGERGAATLLPSAARKSLNPLKRFRSTTQPLEGWFVDNFAGGAQ